MSESLAYLDFGRWVAGCPECFDATLVYHQPDKDGPVVRRTSATCVNGHAFSITMPSRDEEKAIVAAVADRNEAHQAWYPAGLMLAENAGLPTGQTPADLKKETAAQSDEQAEGRRNADLEVALAAAGITVNPDGTFSGKL